MKDYLIKATAFSATVRVYCARTTEIVEHAREIHDTWPAATAAFGRTLTATLLMGSMNKGSQTVTVQIDGGGPIGKIITNANALGNVRGFVSNPQVHMSTNAGKLAVGHVVGNNGTIQVTKDLQLKELFTSTAELQTGEIAEDFTYYFAKSEQVPSSVGLGVLVGEDNKVISSGGFILQIMPGCTEATLQILESNIQKMKPVSDLIEHGYTPEQIVRELVGSEFSILETMPVSYACDCSKTRFEKGIISLGLDEIESMIQDNEPIETTCHFCKKTYNFSVDELKDIYTYLTENQKASS